jgi:hypothetical protein
MIYVCVRDKVHVTVGLLLGFVKRLPHAKSENKTYRRHCVTFNSNNACQTLSLCSSVTVVSKHTRVGPLLSLLVESYSTIARSLSGRQTDEKGWCDSQETFVKNEGSKM